MQNTETKSYSCRHKARSRSFFSKERPQWRWPLYFNCSATTINTLFILAFFVQCFYTNKLVFLNKLELMKTGQNVC